MKLIIDNGEYYLIEEHELIEYLEAKIVDEDINLNDMQLGEKLPPVFAEIKDIETLYKLEGFLKTLKEENGDTTVKRKFECYDCGDIYYQELSEENSDGHYICDECFNNDYWQCGDCGEIISVNEEHCPNNCHEGD